jgi:hypothetical protein
MKFSLFASVLVLGMGLLSCTEKERSSLPARVNFFASFDTSQHFCPSIEKAKVDTLHGWDYCWEFLSPIEKMVGEERFERDRAKRLSSGQKALYFFWYLESEVPNGGFVQYYWNGCEKYLPATIKGLREIGDTAMLALVEDVELEYNSKRNTFVRNKLVNEFSETYEDLEWYDSFDKRFFSLREQTLKKFETYIRKHPEQFACMQ